MAYKDRATRLKAQAAFRAKNIIRLRAYMTKAKRKSRGCPEPTRPMPLHCECCAGLPNGKGGLHVDHDHISGKFRGWLCSSCNTGIGGLGDCVDGVARALEYLVRAI